jgi:hypothetical protein
VTEPAPPERWQRRPEVLWRRSLDAVLFLPPDEPEPLVLAGSGPAVWELLVEPCTIEGITDVLAGAYEVDAATVAADVEAVIGRLAELGAIERV